MHGRAALTSGLIATRGKRGKNKKQVPCAGPAFDSLQVCHRQLDEAEK